MTDSIKRLKELVVSSAALAAYITRNGNIRLK